MQTLSVLENIFTTIAVGLPICTNTKSDPEVAFCVLWNVIYVTA